MVICFFGDSLTLGVGDATRQGWPGRIISSMPSATAYNLGVRKDTTLKIHHRWHDEATHRALPDTPLKLVFSFGVADIMNQIETEQSLAAALMTLTNAQKKSEVLVVGPPPVLDAAKTEDIALLSDLFKAMCKQINIPFIPTVDELTRSAVYQRALAAGDTVHPTQEGYDCMAALIQKHETTRHFLGLE